LEREEREAAGDWDRRRCVGGEGGTRQRAGIGGGAWEVREAASRQLEERSSGAHGSLSPPMGKRGESGGEILTDEMAPSEWQD
jgi:hypothetical protein